MDKIIDANANRAREGARVLEDLSRFIIEDSELSYSWKQVRHRITEEVGKICSGLPIERQPETDCGRKQGGPGEESRKDFCHIAMANAKRTEEGIRVLEEFAKLASPEAGKSLKQLRFRVYELEKQTLIKLREQGR